MSNTIYSKFSEALPFVEEIHTELKRSRDDIAPISAQRALLEEEKRKLLAMVSEIDAAILALERNASPHYRIRAHCQSLLNNLSVRNVPPMDKAQIVECLLQHNLRLGTITTGELLELGIFDVLFSNNVWPCNIVAVTWDIRNQYVRVTEQGVPARAVRFNYDACSTANCCFCENAPLHSQDHAVLAVPLTEIEFS